MFTLPTTRVTKKFLLEKNPAERYFEYYLGVTVKKGLFKSPSVLRKDNHPTCAFYKNSKGDLIFKDFAGVSGDFVKIVMEIHRVSYYKALNIIANDFGYVKLEDYTYNPPKKEYSGNILKETERSNIQVEIQDFSDKELKWWDSFGISIKTLKKFKVFSIKHVFLNGNYFMSSTEQSPIYGYYGGKTSEDIDLWRLYMPTKRNFRFLSNWSKSQWHGSKQLPNTGEHCIITKSMKDLMLLYEFGFTSIAPTSENILITEAQFSKLVSKFSKVILLFDNDYAGVRSANKYKKKYGCKCIFIKRRFSKDASDLYKKVSSSVFWEIVEEINSILKDDSIRKTKHFYIF